MTITESIYRWRTYVPLVFERAVTGPPVVDAPDVDARSFKSPEHGPVIGIMAGQTVRVAIRRVHLDSSAPLFVTTTNSLIVVPTGLSSGQLPTGERVILHLRAQTGGAGTPSMRSARILVRFGETGGPVLAALTVVNSTQKSVDVTPHFVTISGAGGTPRGPDAVSNFSNILSMVQAIWRPCGVVFNPATISTDSVAFTRAGEVSERELDRLLNTSWNRNTINIYFVHLLRVPSIPDLLGVGISPARKAEVGVTKPGIVLADTNTAGDQRDVQYWANDLAHEIGHFLSLVHVGNRSDETRFQNPWARRMLMYQRNTQDRANAPLAYRSNVGYGEFGGWHHRGCLLTMKSVPGVSHDGECGMARSTIQLGNAFYGP